MSNKVLEHIAKKYNLSGKVGCNAQEVADTLKMFDM